MSTAPGSIYSRKNPFPAKHITNRRLSGDTSEKETRHHELSLEGSGLNYEVGDALGVFASNHHDVVEEIIHAIHATGEELVPGSGGEPKVLRAALLHDYIITQPSKEFIAAMVAKGGDAVELLRTLSDPLRKHELEVYLHGMEVIDFLHNHPSISWTPEELIKSLRKLQPRLYSIASSRKMVGEAVHLTIATVRYDSHGRKRHGVASTYLADRTSDGRSVPVFIHTANHFRLPTDPATDVIMVGPGTGVAPFRAFLQERQATGAPGRNWLFFGEQRRSSDFLYEQELIELQNKGVLTHLELAFSRDIPGQKVYVQHRMKERGKEIFEWLEGGAHFFVCGDGARMAKDVDAELQAIAMREGGKTTEEAALWVEALKKEKRYKRDVY